MVDGFEGKVGLVTGAGRGIGATIATALALKGAVVASADLLPNVDWTNKLSTPNTQHYVDVRSKQSCEELIQSVIKSHGRLDILRIYLPLLEVFYLAQLYALLLHGS